MTASASAPAWARSVAWERADLLRPATYAALLGGADAVVHSMGILLEADYKGVLQGRESPLAGLRRAFAPRAARGVVANPLERGEEAAADGPGGGEGGDAPQQQLTYETMNRDSAISLARAAARSGVSAFAYVSAAGGAPVLPARYLTTKREAESAIATEFPRMRGVFIRPPFMYDAAARPVTVPLAAATAVGALLNGATGGVLSGFLGAGGVKPLKVDVVAEALVEALDDEAVKGVMEVKEIEALAEKAWRKTML